MSERKPQPEYSIPVWGVFLLFLGIVFLLQTIGIIPWGLWATLWRFWPILIIAFGLGILLRHYNPWLASTLLLVMFLACLGVSFCQYESSVLSGETASSYKVPMDRLQSADVEIDFTAGSLIVNSLPRSSSDFVEVISGAENSERTIRASFLNQDGIGRLNLTTERVNRQFWNETLWDIALSRDLPLTLDVEANICNIDIDLGELKINGLEMDIDASNCQVIMPASTGAIRAHIKADIANLEIIIPDSSSARIKINSDLASVHVDSSRFQYKNGYYISDDFDAAASQIELEINCNIGRVEVK